VIDVEELKADIDECIAINRGINGHIGDYINYMHAKSLFDSLSCIMAMTDRLNKIYAKLDK